MPPKNDNFRHVADKIVPAFTTAPAGQQNTNVGFPTGNEGIQELDILWAGTFNTSGAAGAPVVDGALKLLRSVRVHTDKHGDLIKGVDGLGMHRMIQMSHEERGAVVDCATNADATTFRAQLRIPFADQDRLLRPYDALIDMSQSIMDVKTQYGVVTDVQSAGTAATVNGLREDIDVEVIPSLSIGEKDAQGNYLRDAQGNYVGSEIPKFMPVWERLADVVATAGSSTIPIPTGDRLVRRIHINQVTIDPVTGLQTEVSTIINRTSKVTLKIGTDLIIDGVTYGSLNDKNKGDVRGSAMPAGWVFMAFDRQKSVQKMLDLYQYPSGLSAFIFIDTINTVANGFLRVYMEYFQAIPNQAKRPL